LSDTVKDFLMIPVGNTACMARASLAPTRYDADRSRI
jgi:hypothetical protein